MDTTIGTTDERNKLSGIITVDEYFFPDDNGFLISKGIDEKIVLDIDENGYRVIENTMIQLSEVVDLLESDNAYDFFYDLHHLTIIRLMIDIRDDDEDCGR